MADPFVLDKAAIMKRLGGDEEIFAMMAGMYLQDAEDYCTRMAAALAAGDGPLLLREIHTIKGVLATFSDEAGAALAWAVEQRARQGQLEGLQAMVAEVQVRVRQVAAALHSLTQA